MTDLNPWVLAPLVFVAALLTDIVWARYTLAVTAKNRWTSAGWSLGIFTMGAIGITAYVSNIWLLVPVALGGATGTFLAVGHDAKSCAEVVA